MKSNSLFHCMIGCVKALTKYLEIYFKFVNFLRSEIGTCLFLRDILRLNCYIFIQYKCVSTIWTETFTNFLWNTLSGQLYGQLIRGNKLCKLQGGNEVCFFIADPIFVHKFLILDSKSVFVPDPTNMVQPDPWSLKKLLISIPWSVIPDPTPLIPDPTYLVTTLKLCVLSRTAKTLYLQFASSCLWK